MRRFLITSKKFAGTAELIYNQEGDLTMINTRQSDLKSTLLAHFKHSVPVHVDAIETAFSNETTIVEADFEITFDMFWNEYGLKINRKRCEQLWDRLSTSKKVAAWLGIVEYKKFLKANEWRKQADPETYLKKEYWENEWK
jgi:hypothetical protein